MKKYYIFKTNDKETAVYLENDDIPQTLIVYREGEKTKIFTKEHATKRWRKYEQRMEISRRIREFKSGISRVFRNSEE